MFFKFCSLARCPHELVLTASLRGAAVVGDAADGVRCLVVADHLDFSTVGHDHR